MIRQNKKQLLPKIAVPMHETIDAFKADMKRDGVPEDHDVLVSLRGIDKVDSRLKKINEVRSKILSDKTLNDAAKKAEYLKYVNKVKDSLMKDIFNVTRIVDRKTSQIHEVINRPITDEASSRDAQEIRQWFNQNIKDQSDKIAWVSKKINQEDWETASALLGKKSFMSNLKEEHQKSLTDIYRKKRFADEMKVNKVMEKVGAAMIHKIDMIGRFEKEISGEDTVAALESQRAREEAMK